MKDCLEVYKNILWMYYDMATSYGGFGHNIEYEKVNYRLYSLIQTEIRAYQPLCTKIKHGCVVAVGCEVINLLDDEQRDPATLDAINGLLKTPGLAKIDFEFFSLCKKALRSDVKNIGCDWELTELGKKLKKTCNKIYKRYVIGDLKSVILKGLKRKQKK